MKNIFSNRNFLLLFSSQTISLFGDALTWTGLALLAYRISPDDSSLLLATALSIRVVTFVLVAPFAPFLSRRINGKLLLLALHILRMLNVLAFLFTESASAFYLAIFTLNLCNALFTPNYKAYIPLVVPNKQNYPQAISISSTVFQLLSVFGPGIAGIMTALFGLHSIFISDSLTFLLAAVILTFIPFKALIFPVDDTDKKGSLLTELKLGTSLLFKDRMLLIALLMQLVTSIVGANILVNTVAFVKNTLEQGDGFYGWVMGSFGLGTVLSALAGGYVKQEKKQFQMLMIGGVVSSLALFPAAWGPSWTIFLFWFVAGLGEGAVTIPFQTLIAERLPLNQQSHAYAAQFSWSHLWWVAAYPLANVWTKLEGVHAFLLGGGVALILWLLFTLFNFYLLNKSKRVLAQIV